MRRATAALQQARSELEEAGQNQRERDRLIAIEQKKLDDLKAERMNKGRGRLNATHASRVNQGCGGDDREAAVCMACWAAGRSDPSVPRTTSELLGLAAQRAACQWAGRQIRISAMEARQASRARRWGVGR